MELSIIEIKKHRGTPDVRCPLFEHPNVSVPYRRGEVILFNNNRYDVLNIIHIINEHSIGVKVIVEVELPVTNFDC